MKRVARENLLFSLFVIVSDRKVPSRRSVALTLTRVELSFQEESGGKVSDSWKKRGVPAMVCCVGLPTTSY